MMGARSPSDPPEAVASDVYSSSTSGAFNENAPAERIATGQRLLFGAKLSQTRGSLGWGYHSGRLGASGATLVIIAFCWDTSSPVTIPQVIFGQAGFS
jgi:hypothetical protein